MNSFRGSIQLLSSQCLGSSRIFHLRSITKIPLSDDAGINALVPTYSGSDGFTTVKVVESPGGSLKGFPLCSMISRSQLQVGMGIQMEKTSFKLYESSTSMPLRSLDPRSVQRAEPRPPNQCRSIATTVGLVESTPQDPPPCVLDVPPRIKFKRLDKTAKHIMQIIDTEAVEEVRSQRDIPDIQPGYIVQLKVEVPENKRRVSILKGIVIARRNAGLNSTFRIRRLVAGVGVESMFPLYSPNIKEIKVLEKKKVRRAKLYYLRDKMNALKKH